MRTGWRRAAADARLFLLHILSLPARFDPVPGPGPEDGPALSDAELGQLRELRDSWDEPLPKRRGNRLADLVGPTAADILRDEHWNIVKEILGLSAKEYDPHAPGASYSDLFDIYEGIPDDDLEES